ncbi:MAG: SGNH/GDSL hydrolase family protein [Lentisphaeria bacterium]|nr:SGNH/GDSL hydrolase family protein [Lentisphaeria bacterium]
MSDKKIMQDKLLLPKVLYGSAGVEMNLYFANVFTCVNPANYIFHVYSSVGRCDTERWRFVPETAGTYEAKIEVISDEGVVAEGSFSIVISDPAKAAGRKLRILMIGDSLTDQTCYPAHLHTLCERNNIELIMLGTNVPLELKELPGGKMINYPPDKELEGVRHEGRGGWSAATFLRRKEPIECETDYHWNCASPFLTPDGVFDFKGYIDKNCDGIVPDIIMISLGGNDMINITRDNSGEVIGRYLENMQQLYENIRKDAPDALYGIVLEPYGSMDQSAWGDNYGCSYFAWNRRSLVPPAYAKLSEIFSAKENCSMVPLYTAVDPIYGYPRKEEKCFAESDAVVGRGDNALHPAPAGYRQAANCAFGWLLDIISKGC